MNGFLAATGDADQRHASINDYLLRVFSGIAPADLSGSEASALVEALDPAFRRVTGTTVSQGAPRVPRASQLREILTRVKPADLSATEAILVLTILMPVHSRAIIARSTGTAGQPVQRLLLAPME